jgi:Tol biopolymer transport system component
MATGRRAFPGNSQASVITSIMSSEPAPLSSEPRDFPAPLVQLVRTCLAKDPANRWQTAHDVMVQLKWMAQAGSQAGVPIAALPRKKGVGFALAWSAVATVLLLAAAWPTVQYFRGSSPASQFRFLVGIPETPNPFQISIAPDGKRLAFVAVHEGRQMLWVRPLDAVEAQPLPGTEGASNPFWSPDSRYIGFGANNILKRVDASGGAPQTICEGVSSALGLGTWNEDGTIIFGSLSGLQRVSASGGSAITITVPDASRGETAHSSPWFLPDGRHYLYFSSSTQPENRAIYAGSLDSDQKIRLVNADSMGQYAPQGYLLYQREGTLLAHPFDADRLELKGEPTRLAEQIPFNLLYGRAAFAVSETGVLIYRSGTETAVRQLTWFDRRGNIQKTIGDPGSYANPDLSHDGKRLAVESVDAQTRNRDIWITDLDRGVATRFTFDPQSDGEHVWSPDGSRIAFRSERTGRQQIYVKSTGGLEMETPLTESNVNENPMDWFPDGRSLLFLRQDGGKTGLNLWLLPLEGDTKPVPVLQTNFSEIQAQVSPDGRYIAYANDESGEYQIYVMSFPSKGGKSQVSKDGGMQPRWRQDGTELFYIAADGTLMTVPVSLGQTFEAGSPVRLFPTPIDGSNYFADSLHDYAVSSDGQRFLLNLPAPTGGNPLPITVVVNWTSSLNR